MALWTFQILFFDQMTCHSVLLFIYCFLPCHPGQDRRRHQICCWPLYEPTRLKAIAILPLWIYDNPPNKITCYKCANVIFSALWLGDFIVTVCKAAMCNNNQKCYEVRERLNLLITYCHFARRDPSKHLVDSPVGSQAMVLSEKPKGHCQSHCRGQDLTHSILQGQFYF